jgi:phenylalanyl-tRNA synthetase beta subunit
MVSKSFAIFSKNTIGFFGTLHPKKKKKYFFQKTTVFC